MRTIAIMNQKGGVGKTTTSVNLSAALARAGRRVVLIDLDPQGHASIHLGIDGSAPGVLGIYDVFGDECTLAEARHLVEENLWVVPAHVDLAAAETELAGFDGRELILREAIEDFAKSESIDYIIMDCPPSLGLLTINALTAVQEIIIPLQPHFFALQGMSKLFETTALVTRRLNRSLRVSGIVLCLYETGTRLATDVTDDLTAFLDRSEPTAPWAQAQILKTRIRRNIKLAEAPGHGQPIFDYASNCPGAQDYRAMCVEVMAAESKPATVTESPATLAMPQQPQSQSPRDESDEDLASRRHAA